MNCICALLSLPGIGSKLPAEAVHCQCPRFFFPWIYWKKSLFIAFFEKFSFQSVRGHSLSIIHSVTWINYRFEWHLAGLVVKTILKKKIKKLINIFSMNFIRKKKIRTLTKSMPDGKIMRKKNATIVVSREPIFPGTKKVKKKISV